MKHALTFLTALLLTPLASLHAAEPFPTPAAPVIGNHSTHDYAERIRERLPRRLQELREPMGLSNVHPGS